MIMVLLHPNATMLSGMETGSVSKNSRLSTDTQLIRYHQPKIKEEDGQVIDDYDKDGGPGEI